LGAGLSPAFAFRGGELAMQPIDYRSVRLIYVIGERQYFQNRDCGTLGLVGDVHGDDRPVSERLPSVSGCPCPVSAPRAITSTASAASCDVGKRPRLRSASLNASKPVFPRGSMNPRQRLPSVTVNMSVT
jgi:hypothetical protein